MVWIKSATNGNVVEVADLDHARLLEADGHELHETDPRTKKPTGKKPASK